MAKEIYSTGKGKIRYMCVAKAFPNAKKNGVEEFSIKMELTDEENGQVKEHIRSIRESQIDTPTNRSLAGTGKFLLNLVSNKNHPPKVYDANGTELVGREIPFFDGRIDSGVAEATYVVLTNADGSVARLNSVKLLELNLASREQGSN